MLKIFQEDVLLLDEEQLDDYKLNRRPGYFPFKYYRLLRHKSYPREHNGQSILLDVPTYPQLLELKRSL